MLIPDKIILPAITMLMFTQYLEGTLSWSSIVGACLVVLVFLIPIFFNMKLGGGDLRFAFFGALFVGIEGIGYFVILSGLIHILLLKSINKDYFGFAPAMSLAAIIVYGWLLL